MKKSLFSFILMFVFAVPFVVQAENIGVAAPVYQADKLTQVVDTGQKKIFAAANTVNTANQNHKLKSFITCFEMTEPKKSVITADQCAACYSTVTGFIGVPGGDSIGIRQLS